MSLPAYSTLLAEFGDHPRARLLAAAKYGSEAQWSAMMGTGALGFFIPLNIYAQDPQWNEPQGGGAPGVVIDPNTHD